MAWRESGVNLHMYKQSGAQVILALSGDGAGVRLQEQSWLNGRFR